ncbi:MAG: hypothetical protein WCR08_07035 [Gammaproteobacteria bacterium]|jgi:hypothetical protein|nr:hypothetical protein [Legionellales bacterium]NDH66947.1 hypothetical protein [Gammaproteobacteria bacterium]
MDKLTIKSSLIIASLGIIMLNSEVVAFGNPCQGIAKACMQEGYSKGAQPPHRLILDCVKPVVENKKTVSYDATDEEKQQCAQMIAQKMQQQ